jgi:hypothetical protein
MESEWKIMIHTQKYIKENGVDSLKINLGISINHHGKYPNLICLKYNQIESPRDHPVVQECRGIILDENEDYKIVSRSMNRFFNFGEGIAAAVDFENATIQTKEDGSLITLYWYDDKWNVATTGTADAASRVNGWSYSFSELFWDTWNKMGWNLPTDTNRTYFFELTSPYNRVVVDHDKAKLTLLGSRRLDTQVEVSPYVVAKEYGWTAVESHDFKDIKSVLQHCEGLRGFVQEGFVVCDHKFRRIKIKSPDYIRLHHAVSSTSINSIVDVVRNGETSEVIGAFPGFADKAKAIAKALKKLVDETEDTYLKINVAETQKEFALEACKYPYSAALFAVRNGKAESFNEYYSYMALPTLINLLCSHGLDLKELNE